jgi:hypothetical protein
MSMAGWFIVLLALVSANVPFLNQRLFAEVNPVRWTGSHVGRVLRRAPELDFREILRQSWKLLEVRKHPGVPMAQHRDTFLSLFSPPWLRYARTSIVRRVPEAQIPVAARSPARRMVDDVNSSSLRRVA